MCVVVRLLTTLLTAPHRRPPNVTGFRYNREDDEIGLRVRGILRGVVQTGARLAGSHDIHELALTADFLDLRCAGEL